MYIDVKEVGKMKDKEGVGVFEGGGEELKGVGEIDYEGVKNGKGWYLKVMLEERGRKVVGWGELKKLFEENEDWVVG